MSQTTFDQCGTAISLGFLLVLVAGCSRDAVLIRPAGDQGSATGGGTAGSAGSGGASGGGPCHASTDCPPGSICVYETGACVAETPDACAPGTSSGTVGEGEKCGDGMSACGAGLVCVPHWLRMDMTTGVYGPDWQDLSGVCEPSCDPCQGPCATGECIGLREGGGFCAPGPLAREGEICLVADVEFAFCEAGTMCWSPSSQPGSTCVRHCTPDVKGAWAGATSTSAPSADCPAGDVCTLAQSSAHGPIFLCQHGTFLATGRRCNDPEHPERVCAFPDACRNAEAVTNDPIVAAVPGTCSSGCSDCPKDTVCRFEGQTSLPSEACVAPGEVGRVGYCEADSDCQTGLHCQTWAGDMKLHCL